MIWKRRRRERHGAIVCHMGKADTYRLSDEKAVRMMIALREGRTLRTFGVRPARLQTNFTDHPEFAREARPLMEANTKAAHLRKGAYLREKSHCVNGHSLAEFGRVAMHKGWMTRQCRACEVMRYRRGGIMKPAVLEQVRARIAAGSPPNRFTKPGAGYLLRFDTFARYRRENPEFNRLVIEARESRVYRTP
jgi:hypothetical protein